MEAGKTPDAQSVAELLPLVGKTLRVFERDVALLSDRYKASEKLRPAAVLDGEVAKMQGEKRHLLAEASRVRDLANQMVRDAEKPLLELQAAEDAKRSEATGLRYGAGEFLSRTGRNRSGRIAELNREINSVKASSGLQRHCVEGPIGRECRKTIDELTPQLERLDRIHQGGGSDLVVAEREQIRERLAQAHEAHARTESYKPIVAEANRRIAELRAEQERLMTTVPAWDDVDLFPAPATSVV
ncbi:MAG TPA: hypothetical protein VHX65_13410 [Pirellulales bacterium]|nr:hypothetical protein [Pirellulales bacterium]